MPEPVDVFVSYAVEDTKARTELAKHLALLEQQGVIRSWCAEQILPGEEVQKSIHQKLNAARLILFLISADFLATRCLDEGGEMALALERSRKGEARIIPILVRACDWRIAPFAGLRVLPDGQVPVKSWPNRDEAWKNVARSIRETVKSLSEARGMPLTFAPMPALPFAASSVTAAGPVPPVSSSSPGAVSPAHRRGAAPHPSLHSVPGSASPERSRAERPQASPSPRRRRSAPHHSQHSRVVALPSKPGRSKLKWLLLAIGILMMSTCAALLFEAVQWVLREQERADLLAHPEKYLTAPGIDVSTTDTKNGDGIPISYVDAVTIHVSNKSKHAVDQIQGEVSWIDNTGQKIGAPISCMLRGLLPAGGTAAFNVNQKSGTLQPYGTRPPNAKQPKMNFKAVQIAKAP